MKRFVVAFVVVAGACVSALWVSTPEQPRRAPTLPEEVRYAPPHVERAFQDALEYLEKQRPLVGEEQYKRDKEELLEMLTRARRQHPKVKGG